MRRAVLFGQALSTVICAPTFAADASKEEQTVKLGLELRIENENDRTTWDHPDKTVHQNGVTQKFVLAAAKVNLRGTIDDKTSFRFRYNFANDFSAASAATSGVADGVQFAFISRTVTPWLTVSAGKLYIEGGSYENEYVSASVYHYSETFGQTPSYDTGAMAAFNFGDQSISVQVLNSSPDNVAKRGRDYIKAVAWHGSLFGGHVLPVTSYAIYPRPQLTTDDGHKDDAATTTELSLGTRVNVANFELEGVYGDVHTPAFTAYDVDKTTNVGSLLTQQHETDRWQVLYGLVRYKLAQPRLEPFMKLTVDDHRTDNVVVGHFTRFSGGVEYYPTPHSPFWYHLVYVHQDNRHPAATVHGSELQTQNNQQVSTLLLGTGAVY